MFWNNEKYFHLGLKLALNHYKRRCILTVWNPSTCLPWDRWPPSPTLSSLPGPFIFRHSPVSAWGTPSPDFLLISRKPLSWTRGTQVSCSRPTFPDPWPTPTPTTSYSLCLQTRTLLTGFVLVAMWLRLQNELSGCSTYPSTDDPLPSFWTSAGADR